MIKSSGYVATLEMLAPMEPERAWARDVRSGEDEEEDDEEEDSWVRWWRVKASY
jgi:hypothetical protein